MPSPYFYQDYDDELPIHQLTKRFQTIPWFDKRNSALCDYRLQLRPLPLTSALCAYGHNKEEHHQTNPFKYG